MSPQKKRDWMIDGELELLFRIQESGNNDVSCSPCVKINENGKPSLFHISDAHIFNALVYLATCSRFVTMNFESLKLLAAGWGRSKEIPRNDFSKFLEENMAILSIGTTTLPQDGSAFDLFSNTEADDYKRIAEPEMITGIDHIDLRPVALTDTQCRIAISYVCGSHSISMKDLVETRRNRRRFLFAGDCIVDCSSPGVRKIVASSKSAGPDGVIELSRAAMLQFRGGALSTRFRGDKTLVRQVKELLEFKPASELPASGIYTGTLRDYQERGVAWLLFLYQNNFGGLLCDDMGLGKTHQVIACIANAKEHFKGHGRVLVVCPTTVLNHWLSLLERFAPAITRMVYHSKDRKDSFDETCDVVLTTYGILRNDIETLRLLPFTIAIFDEAQQIKNPETASYAAAGKVRANVKIGLTGTPIENSMDDLKTLFDLVLPGLLDSATVSEESLLEGTEAASRLKPLTAPFILRRLKKSVLTELPPKIEDRRICTLSADQLALYEFAVEKRARPLASQLQDESKPVPYMHIFSLLNYFKMVCNHPALAGNTPALFDKYESGKWDLFLELLGESLGSRQKVVVFTQYLGMVEIFKNYLERSNIGHSILTGATRDRAAPIKAFAEDEACRVFVASLKAGGTGIDLVAGSVVVHYDRWWNAAREDQATDRVHRIGQVRGVQVIKLITEHTIEERIDEMIEKKRQLADEALVEDAPDALKTFSREELYAMLTVR
jgi:superfamily II DNA or RNA helicase